MIDRKKASAVLTILIAMLIVNFFLLTAIIFPAPVSHITGVVR